MKLLFSLCRRWFGEVTADEYAEDELTTAKLRKLQYESMAEYAQSQVDLFTKRIERLEKHGTPVRGLRSLGDPFPPLKEHYGPSNASKVG